MFRKLSLALVAAVSLGAAALAPTSASAWGWHGGWHGGWHHGFGGPRLFVGGPVYYGSGYSTDMAVAMCGDWSRPRLGPAGA